MKTTTRNVFGGLALTAALVSGCGDEEFAAFLGRQLNFLLVPNTASTNVDIRLLEQGSGIPGPGVQVGTGNHPTMVAITPNGALAYVPNADEVGTISYFNINPDNSNFAQSPTSPAPVDFPPCTVNIHPGGRFLYAVGDNDITGFGIGDSGFLTPLGDTTFEFGGKGTVGITPGAFFRDGQFFFHNAGDLGVAEFQVNSDTGALNQLEGIGIDGRVTSITRLPNSEILLVARRDFGQEPARAELLQGHSSGVLESYRVEANGATTFIDAEPFEADPMGVVASTRGFAYVGTISPGSGVLAFQVDANGNISNEVAFAAGGQDSSYPGVDPSGNFVFVSAQSTNQVFGFRIDEGGNMITLNGSPFTGYSAPGVPTLAFYQL